MAHSLDENAQTTQRGRGVVADLVRALSWIAQGKYDEVQVGESDFEWFCYYCGEQEPQIDAIAHAEDCPVFVAEAAIGHERTELTP